MDSSSIIIGIVLTVVIIGATIYFASAGKRKLKKELDVFLSNLKDKSIHIDEYGQIGQYIIGIDTNSGFLVYKKGINEPEVINLKNINNCTDNVPEGDKIKNLNHNLFIELISKNSNESKISLEIYDSTFLLNPNKEVKFIKNWSDKINNYLKSR